MRERREDSYIHFIIIISVLPTVIHIVRERKDDNEIKEAIEETREEIETIVKK